jgi:hypothetical protein
VTTRLPSTLKTEKEKEKENMSSPSLGRMGSQGKWFHWRAKPKTITQAQDCSHWARPCTFQAPSKKTCRRNPGLEKKEMDPNPSLEYIYYFGFLVSNLFCIGLRKNNVVSKPRRVVVNKLVNILARLCINYSWKILNT